MATRQTQYTFDAAFELKDAGLVAASAAAQVDSSDQIIDTGSTTAFMSGDVVIDVSAIEIASNDEVYTLILEGSTSATFASDIEELAVLRLGANEVLTGGGDVDSDTGRYILPFHLDRNGRRYRYLRMYTVVAGTVATGINYIAYASKMR